MGKEYDVIVVGGGPTGMAVAGDLARSGRSVVVLEQHAEVNPASRAFAVMPRTLELLDARGLADDLVAGGSPTERIEIFSAASLDLIGADSRFPFVLITPQTRVDAALTAYAEAQGAEISRGTQATALVQDDAGVTVTSRARSRGPDDADTRTWRASYVVAADGAHSAVRAMLGIEFPGQEVLSSMVLADVRLGAGPQTGGLTATSTPDNIGFLAPYGDGQWYRFMGWDRHHQVPDSEPVDEAEVERDLAAAFGHDFDLAEVGWHSRFHCDERQVAAYRHGRVLMAGDAAHVHSPVGGQGMNTGIQDAVNLAWKLDAALGGAPDAVLDSYHDERHPIGRQVVRQSGAMLRMVKLHPRPLRWLRDRVAPRVLGVPAIGRWVGSQFSGLGLRYQHPRGERLVGTRAAMPLVGEPLTVVQRDARWVLVRACGEDVLDVSLAQAERRDQGPALLVRPDGYVAWAGASAADQGWRAALEQWTGRADLAVPATA